MHLDAQYDLRKASTETAANKNTRRSSIHQVTPFSDILAMLPNSPFIPGSNGVYTVRLLSTVT